MQKKYWVSFCVSRSFLTVADRQCGLVQPCGGKFSCGNLMYATIGHFTPYATNARSNESDAGSSH